MQPTIETDRRGIVIDGKHVYLYSGECEYYRLPPDRWKELLSKIKEAGCNAVCTYIPWNWHEPEEGRIDLTGRTDPRRGLMRFLDEVASNGLYLIFRPGPYICNEWLNGGIPGWLLTSHPEIRALSSNGKPLPSKVMYPPITYLHPSYQEHVRIWYNAVFEVVIPYLYPNGGPVLCVYLDDEPSYWWGLWDPLLLDYNPVVVGHSRRAGFYQQWLKETYGDITDLNEVYRQTYRAFEEVAPPYDYPRNYGELLHALDWYWCKLAMIDEYVLFLYRLVEDKNIKVPLAFLNAYLQSHMAWSKFSTFCTEKGLNLLHTTETYWSMVFETSDGREDKIGNICAQLEMYKSARREAEYPLLCMEMQAGVAYHETPQQLQSLYLLSIAHGINGINFFTMTGGENPRGYGYLTGGSYDISAPVGMDGEVRPSYFTIKRLGQWIETHRESLLATETCNDIAVGYYEPYEAAGYQGNTLDCGFRDDYRDFFDNYYGYYLCQRYNAGLLTLLALSGLSYAMVDLCCCSAAELRRYPQLWVAGLDFMHKNVQEKLVAYVEQGGHLILSPRVPELNERMQPCTRLRTLYPAGPITPENGTKWGRLTPSGTVFTSGGFRLAVRDYIDHFELAGKEEAVAFDEADGVPCAYTVAYGTGNATLLGFKLRYAWDSKNNHQRFIHWLLERDGIRRSTFAENPDVIVRERMGEGKGFLFVINPTQNPQSTKIRFTDPRERSVHVLPTHLEALHLPGQGGLALALNLSIGQAGEIIYCTSEILSYKKIQPGRIHLSIQGPAGTMGEIALRTW
ncbi:MAG: beta-galactosidase, partial [Spirochaetota bacterium]